MWWRSWKSAVGETTAEAEAEQEKEQPARCAAPRKLHVWHWQLWQAAGVRQQQRPAELLHSSTHCQ